MTNGEYTIEALHVAKSFGRGGVLKDVTFGIREGEIVGIAGEHGSRVHGSFNLESADRQYCLRQHLAAGSVAGLFLENENTTVM